MTKRDQNVKDVFPQDGSAMVTRLSRFLDETCNKLLHLANSVLIHRLNDRMDSYHD